MDSACARAMTTNPSDAGAYLLETVDLKMRMGQYEAAAKDYNQYYEHENDAKNKEKVSEEKNEKLPTPREIDAILGDYVMRRATTLCR